MRIGLLNVYNVIEKFKKEMYFFKNFRIGVRFLYVSSYKWVFMIFVCLGFVCSFICKFLICVINSERSLGLIFVFELL